MTSVERPADEIANLVTHGMGFLLSLAGVGYLLKQMSGRPAALQAACIVYGASLILVYGSSTLSHALYDATWRRRYRTLDQASIFLLIAGTYTPFGVTYLNHGGWWLLLAAMWGLAGMGVWRVLHVRDLSSVDKVAFGILGLLPIISLGELWHHAPPRAVFWIIGGGACYLIGTPFLRLSSSIRYAHAVWHLLVMAGSACHYWAVVLVVALTK